MKRTKNIKEITGITLIALVITIVILIILASVAITTSLSDTGLFSRVKQAREDYQIATNEEELKVSKLANDITTQIDGNRSSTARKDIILKNQNERTTEVKLPHNASEWDFIIVYYRVVNSTGSIVFDTSETSEYSPTYTFSSYYCIGNIKLDIETNKINVTASGNDTGWNNTTTITKVIGVKL